MAVAPIRTSLSNCYMKIGRFAGFPLGCAPAKMTIRVVIERLWARGYFSMAEISVAEAKARLTGLLHRVEDGEAVHITRRGKAVAVLVSESEYATLQSLRPTQGLWDAIADWRAQTPFDWPDLMPEEVAQWRDPSPGRTLEWPE
jgi:prevent-host-death family protein